MTMPPPGAPIPDRVEPVDEDATPPPATPRPAPGDGTDRSELLTTASPAFVSMIAPGSEAGAASVTTNVGHAPPGDLARASVQMERGHQPPERETGHAPDPAPMGAQGASDALLGYLQQASRAGNDLREYLLALDAEPTDPVRLVRVDEVADRVIRQVDTYLAKADALLDPAGMRRWSGDSLTHIRNVWDSIASERERLDQAPHAPARHLAIVELVRLIDDAGSAAGWITIPPRINDHLANIAVGEELDFDALFADEIPNPALRSKLFDALARNTLLLTGYCDAETRRITRISPSRARQWISIVATLAIAVACAGGLALVNLWDDAPGLPAPDARLATGTVVISVVIVWAGTLSHFALSWYKGYRNNDLRVPRSATRVLFWINSKEVALWGAVVTGAVLTGVFALTRTIDQPAALLAIGYSFDSIADALFPRFESRMVRLAGALPGPAQA